MKMIGNQILKEFENVDGGGGKERRKKYTKSELYKI